MTNKDIAQKLDELMDRLPQPEVDIPLEVREYYLKNNIPIPKAKSPKDNQYDTINNKLNFIFVTVCLLVLMVLPLLLSFDGCKQNPTPPDKTVNVKTWGDKIYAEAVKKKIDPIGTPNAEG